MRRYIYLDQDTPTRKETSDASVKHHVLLAFTLCVILLLLVLGSAYCATLSSRLDAKAMAATLQARIHSPVTKPFPAVDTNGLSDIQRKIIDLTRTQYAKHPTSFDQTVLTYTQGEKEAWCADFASWVMREAGIPYINPYSGGWRIPGVYTLQEYFQAHHRYEPVGTYTPKTGDIAFYIGRDSRGAPADGHVTIVISAHGGDITTIGGNEGGRMLIDTQQDTPGLNRLVGFGKLE